ncbi:MAG TPA: acetyl-CoA hydrolase/transferase C-terminal domain-containing protein [Ignavibacteriaceae bacterium]|nr:acetyl-CoA hydrolase/transferase C-terminal domain-containing protein [Ignavibacteriaceae bacterium]
MTPLEELKSKNYIPTNLISAYNKKIVAPEDAVKTIIPGDRIIIQGGCAVPFALVNAMVERKNELHDVEIVHILTVGELPYLKPEMEGHFKHNAYFIGANSRKAVNEGRADFTPIYLYEYPLLFTQGIIPLDVAFIHVSPPDEHGFCSYGVDVGLIKNTADKAKVVIAQVNANMPRTLGDSFIHINKINYIVEVDDPIQELPQVEKNLPPEIENIYKSIGYNISELIDNGSTLQMGIGAIPDAVLNFLYDKKALGIHSEMFSDGTIGLVEQGIITNERKTIHRGKIIAGFVLGTKKLFDFIDNNPLIEFHPQEYVNDPFIISKNDKMVAINSAIEVDITGQVCSDSIGTRLYSGFGGQVDFIRGAAHSNGGKPIIALPATTKDGKTSKIVKQLKPGAGVVTNRADVHYVVTEFGVAQLFGKPIRQRVKELINVAHPAFRDELQFYARENKFI